MSALLKDMTGRAVRLLALLLGTCLHAEAVEVNTANQAELETVAGVGPQLSEAILASRHERPFRDWADFMARLKGIGPVRAGRLSAAGLTVGERAWVPPAAASAPSALRP
jgi:competence protein ComEA